MRQLVTESKVKKLVAIYVRKSRLKDVDSLEIDRQVELLIEYAENNSMDYEIFSEEGSSEDWYGRPELQRMLMALKNGIYDGVLVTDQDRLTRDRTDFGLFVRFAKSEGLLLYTLNKTYNFMNDDDIFTSGIQSEMDNHFMRMTKRKLKRGRIQAIKKGVFFGNPPYGYTKDAEKHLFPHPEESKVVEEIFKLYVDEDKNMTEITEIMRMKGITTRGGANFTIKSTSHILSNIAYRGIVHYEFEGEDKITVEEAHPALIDADTYNKAQQKRHSKRKKFYGLKRGKYLLSHLLVCPKCEQILSFCNHYNKRDARKNLIREEKELYVLNCYSSMSYRDKFKVKEQNLPKCNNLGVKVARLAPVVLESLRQHLTDLDDEIDALMKGNHDFYKQVTKNQQELTLRYNKLEEQKKKVQDGFKMGIYDAEEATAEIKEIKEIQMQVKLQIEELDGADTKSEIERKNRIKTKIEQLLSMDIALDEEKANKLLRQVVDKIYYWKEENDIGKERPFEIKIVYK